MNILVFFMLTCILLDIYIIVLGVNLPSTIMAWVSLVICALVACFNWEVRG